MLLQILKQPDSHLKFREIVCYSRREKKTASTNTIGLHGVFPHFQMSTIEFNTQMHDSGFGLSGPRQVHAVYKCIHAGLYVQ